MMYGVFSQPVGSEAETLHFSYDSIREALVSMGKMISYEAFGNVPAMVIGKVLELIEDLIAEECISKEVRINDKFYYTRKLTDQEVLTITEIPA
jgi:hypothetical protein